MSRLFVWVKNMICKRIFCKEHFKRSRLHFCNTVKWFQVPKWFQKPKMVSSTKNGFKHQNGFKYQNVFQHQKFYQIKINFFLHLNDFSIYLTLIIWFNISHLSKHSLWIYIWCVPFVRYSIFNELRANLLENNKVLLFIAHS